jgi:hypothetical protein
VKDAHTKKRKLEKAMTAAGLEVSDETIPYKEAESRIADISKQLARIGFRHPSYSKLEADMEKYSAALMASDEYKMEIKRREKQWENDVLAANQEALRKLRRHMPVNVRNLSEADLSTKSTPNGKILPKAIARHFKRTKVLQLLRVDPNDIAKMHFADFEGMGLAGLSLTERRALYEHLRPLGPKWEKMKSDKKIGRKWMWYALMRNKFKETLVMSEKHVSEYGPSGKHIGCPLVGNQCPLHAEAVFDYDGDYGFTEEAEYDVLDITREDIDNLPEKAKRDALRAIGEREAFWRRN